MLVWGWLPACHYIVIIYYYTRVSKCNYCFDDFASLSVAMNSSITIIMIQKYQLLVNFAATMDPPVIVNIEHEPAPPQVIIAFFSE